jgi:hypothetical protein
MLLDFCPSHAYIGKRFLQDIFGILGIEADHFCGAKQSALSLLKPSRKLDLVTSLHQSPRAHPRNATENPRSRAKKLR